MKLALLGSALPLLTGCAALTARTPILDDSGAVIGYGPSIAAEAGGTLADASSTALEQLLSGNTGGAIAALGAGLGGAGGVMLYRLIKNRRTPTQ